METLHDGRGNIAKHLPLFPAFFDFRPGNERFGRLVERNPILIPGPDPGFENYRPYHVRFKRQTLLKQFPGMLRSGLLFGK
jgi:hypothetical protein